MSVSEKIKATDLILITIFAAVFSFTITDGIRMVVQKFLQFPNAYLAYWGDTFFLRIFASLIGTATSAFVIGTFLKRKVRLAAVISTFPIIIFWAYVLIFRIDATLPKATSSFETIKAAVLLPSILIILSPVVGYFSAGRGQDYFDRFQRPRSILNIKWYHWLWIFPFYLNKVVAIPLFALILLWKIDANSTLIDSPIFALIFDFGNTISRIIVFFILVGLVASVNHAYSLLSEEKTTAKLNWKNGIIIFGHVLLFSILYILLFAR